MLKTGPQKPFAHFLCRQVTFEVQDALAKMLELQLATRKGGRYAASVMKHVERRLHAEMVAMTEERHPGLLNIDPSGLVNWSQSSIKEMQQRDKSPPAPQHQALIPFKSFSTVFFKCCCQARSPSRSASPVLSRFSGRFSPKPQRRTVSNHAVVRATQAPFRPCGILILFLLLIMVLR